MRWLVLVLVSLIGLSTAHAQNKPSKAQRAEARKLAGEAMDLFAAGDYSRALEKFDGADDLVPAPTLKLRVARSLDKLGRMKEAADKYREVIAYELKPWDKAVYREARKQAVPELQEVMEQIPHVIVTVDGPGSASASVAMGGEPVAADFVGDKQPLDPGFYVFEASADGRTAKAEVNLERGATERVALTLPSPTEPTGPITGGGDTTSSGSDGMWIGGWVALGLGVVGLGVGIGAGAAVLGDESDLEARCPNRRCPPDAHADAESFDTLRIVSTVGFIAGGVGVALGTTLLLLSAGDDEQTGLYLSPMGAGVRGSF